MKAFAEQFFRCEPRDGKAFKLVARFSIPKIVTDVARPGGQHAVMLLSFAPLVPERRCYGANEFQALCLALDFLRSTLRAFVADGGRVYWQDTDAPIDLDSAWFGPYHSLGGDVA